MNTLGESRNGQTGNGQTGYTAAPTSWVRRVRKVGCALLVSGIVVASAPLQAEDPDRRVAAADKADDLVWALGDLEQKVGSGFVERHDGSRSALQSELSKIAADVGTLSQRIRAGEGRKETRRAYHQLRARASQTASRAEHGTVDAPTRDQMSTVLRLLEDLGAYYRTDS